MGGRRRSRWCASGSVALTLRWHALISGKVSGWHITFLITAVTNEDELRDLKQHRFIIFQFWRSEVLKSRCQPGCVPSESGGEALSLPFPLPRGGLLTALPHGPRTFASVFTPSLPPLHRDLTFSDDSGPLSLYGAHSDNPGKSLQLQVLN